MPKRLGGGVFVADSSWISLLKDSPSRRFSGEPCLIPAIFNLDKEIDGYIFKQIDR